MTGQIPEKQEKVTYVHPAIQTVELKVERGYAGDQKDYSAPETKW